MRLERYNLLLIHKLTAFACRSMQLVFPFSWKSSLLAIVRDSIVVDMQQWAIDEVNFCLYHAAYGKIVISGI